MQPAPRWHFDQSTRIAGKRLPQKGSRKVITVDRWTLSDIDCIAIGAFSPLTGFLEEADYESVVESMRLQNGTVWSIPVTLAVDERTVRDVGIGDEVLLAGKMVRCTQC